MDLPKVIHDITVVIMRLVIILGPSVVILINLNNTALSLLALVCNSLFYISPNSYSVALTQFFLYMRAINILNIFVVKFSTDFKYCNGSYL